MSLEEIYLATLAAGSVCSSVLSVLTYIKARHVEHNTNSIKDALVATTRSDALQEGETIGREKQQAEDKSYER